jgi:hypothetical protein
MTEPLAKMIDRINRTPPADREAVERYLSPLMEIEKGKISRMQEIHKDKLIQHRALELQHHKDQADRQSREDAAYAAQQLREKNAIPEVKQDIETGLTFNPETKQWEKPRIEGASPDQKPTFKGTDAQQKTLVNLGRAKIAHEGLKGGGEDALSDSPLQSAVSSLPLGVGRSMRSDVYKEAETHADNFVQAFIRQQSGGAYTPAELETEARAMLPKYGDTAKQIETKREQREQFLSGLSSVVGPSGQKILEIDAAQRTREREAKANKTDDKVLDFTSEAEVAKARLKPGTRIRVNGRSATVQ